MYHLDDWSIRDNDSSVDSAILNGSRMLGGNGYMGRRGAVDEAEASAMPATIIAGLYDRCGNLWREPVNAPDPLYMLLLAGADPLRAGDERTVSHEQALDFRYGIFSRASVWQLPGTSPESAVTLKAERYVHMEDMHLLASHILIRSSVPCSITLKRGINCAVHDLNGPHLGNFIFFDFQDNSCAPLTLLCSTLEKNIPLAVSSVLVPVSGTIRPAENAHNNGLVTYTIDLNGRDEYEFYIYGSSLSSCMYALLSCDTGDSNHAYPYFKKSAEIDITGESKQFAGLVYIGGTHPAANGGAWLTAVRGFCGLSVENGEIRCRPRLPDSWQKVKFSCHAAGVEYEVNVTKDNYTVCRK